MHRWKNKNIAKEKRESDLQKIIKSSQKTTDRKKTCQKNQHEKSKKFYEFYYKQKRINKKKKQNIYNYIKSYSSKFKAE